MMQDNIYTCIEIAFNGKDYCSASADAYKTAKKHKDVFHVQTGLGKLYVYIAFTGVTVINTIIAYIMFAFWPTIFNSISSPVAPLIVVYIGTLIISSMVMHTFRTISNALIYCTLQDKLQKLNHK